MDNAEKIKAILAEHIGVDSEDIKESDSFSDDLHMGPTEMVDFSETLKKAGIDLSDLDFTKINSVGDLLEALETQ